MPCTAEVAKYVALRSSSNRKQQSWQELADQMTAQDLRLALKDAASSGDPAAGAAIAAANRDRLLLALPGAAQLIDGGDTVAAATEAAGWLRPLKFDSAAHRYGGNVQLSVSMLSRARPLRMQANMRVHVCLAYDTGRQPAHQRVRFCVQHGRLARCRSLSTVGCLEIDRPHSLT